MHWSSLALLSLLQRKFCYNSVKKFYMNVNGENILLSDIFPLTPVWCCEMIPILTTCNPLCVACRNVSSSFPSSYSVVFPQSIFYFCLSPLLFSASSFLNILANCSSLVALSFLLPPFSCSHVYLPPATFSCFLLFFHAFPYCHFSLSSLFTVVPPPPPFVVFPLRHLPLPPGGYGWTAGAAAVSPQYVQHAVPTPRPTRLWDPPHLPSTFTFSFTPAPLGPPGGKPQSVKVSVKGTSLILTNTVRHHPSSHQHDAGRWQLWLIGRMFPAFAPKWP